MTLNRLLARFGMLVVALLVVAMNVIAQGKTVTGKVTDSKDGTPVPNASVTVKGTNTGTTTDATGSFRLVVNDANAVLVISSVGYNNYEVTVGSQLDLSISLTAASGTLNEVVVVGYGTQRKKDLTGAIATVSAKDFVKGAIQTPEQLISGKVAGVQITSNNGAAGSGSRIRIRGGASLRASNDPLVVIDGLPVDNGNALSLINPNDIESFTLLKDPSAAAIYGSRASNGVIIITTKKGKKGKVRFNFSAQGFLQNAIKNVDMMNAQEFTSVLQSKPSLASVANLLGKNNTNWQDEIYHPAFGQDYNLSASGAIINGKVPFRVSGGFLNQDGILRTDNFKRYSGALNLSPRFFKDNLKVDLNMKVAQTVNADADFGAIGNAVTFDPTQTIRTNSNRYGGYFEWLTSDGRPASNSNRNPLALLYMRDHRREQNRFIGNIQFDYSIPFVKGLRANLNLGTEFANERGNFVKTDSAAAAYPSIGGKGGYRNRSYLERRNNLYDFYLNYVREIKSIKSRIDFTAGHGMQEYFYYNFNYQNSYFDGSPNGPAPTFLSNNSDDINGDDGYTMLSYYGRLTYSLANKYIITLNGRADGSSRFSKANRWGYFPSAALAWRINEENFLKNSQVVSDLKLRLGYGITGQQDIPGLYPYLAVYNQSNNNGLYQLGSTFYNRLGPVEYDPNIRWETTRNINAAIEYGFYNNRITGILEVFSRNTKDLVSIVPIPLGANFANSLLTNVGTIESKGVEVTMNFIPIKNETTQWDFGFNVTYANPKITRLLINDDPNFVGNRITNISGSVGGVAQIEALGYRPASFYMYQQIYDQNNKPIEGLYEDLNRDGLINEKDLRVFKPSDAPVYFGVSSSVTYKKLNAGFVLRGNIGNYIYNNVAMQYGVLNQASIGAGPQNMHRDYSQTGFINKQELSDYYIQNGSFIRLDNINFGYDAGRIGKNTNLRITANIQNVFVITKYKGIDPEIAGGMDNNIYPRPRTYVLGLNLDF
ncbi:iron complex outermembrane receptor protein [Lacibacter cauensis]|uniref:Iron complex outermembrane receptor protein n=1 Tax=Lacibacter cauensis TaxID=510947 RepID=A0A562SKM3_9BACT|nr:SusC/RagA family TonB-linked outer membrane protein [Lacibacter cauensis]TWI81534.1 iron complex outermembrane receptor protein [Lacibacter cauensis]